MDKYQLYIKKSGTKRWLKKGIPDKKRIVKHRFNRYKKETIYDVRMKLVR